MRLGTVNFSLDILLSPLFYFKWSVVAYSSDGPVYFNPNVAPTYMSAFTVHTHDGGGGVGFEPTYATRADLQSVL